MKKKDTQKTQILKAVGLAVGLPSSILGVFGFSYYLVQKGVISSTVALLLIIIIITYTFYLMVRNANKR